MVIFCVFFLPAMSWVRSEDVLNLLLLLGQDLLAEASSWKLAPGKAFQVSVAGDSQTHRTATAWWQNQRSRGEEIQDNFQEIISLPHLFTAKVSKCHQAP